MITDILQLISYYVKPNEFYNIKKIDDRLSEKLYWKVYQKYNRLPSIFIQKYFTNKPNKPIYKVFLHGTSI